MNNDELKKKLIKIIRQGFATADCRKPYTNVPCPYFDSQIFCIADALIAAGIGDVKEIKNEAIAAELVAQTSASAALERIKEWKHRALVAERKAIVLSKWLADKTRKDYPYQAWLDAAQQQAEKELAEEEKDD